MGKIFIYVKLVDGKLEYRDSEEHHGQKIVTTVDPGDEITWKLDKCSCISEIHDIVISGTKNFLHEGPIKIDFNEWWAKVNSPKIKGEISYTTIIHACKMEKKIKTGKKNGNSEDVKPPIIKPKT